MTAPQPIPLEPDPTQVTLFVIGPDEVEAMAQPCKHNAGELLMALNSNDEFSDTRTSYGRCPQCNELVVREITLSAADKYQSCTTRLMSLSVQMIYARKLDELLDLDRFAL